ncbi:MAG TPA: prenyltransferase/squalene oxidase repeat-containing protein [Gallionella sp.]|nr:prenyltransferase/squalene oxidase repeat-containing protein [Gallionella sp.]
MSLVAAELPIDPFTTRANESRRQARHYLLERQSPSGGFCFYRTKDLDEPNLSDTWHAVAALVLLGELPPHREALLNFVSAQPPDGQPYGLYYRTLTLDVLGSPDPDHAAVKEIVHSLPLNLHGLARHSHHSGQLERMLFILRLKVYFDMEFAAEGIATAMLELEHPNGGFGNPPNLLDTRLALGIAALCGQAACTHTKSFVARLAEPGYAFRLTENSLSPNLETICAGIECCQRLELPVAYPKDAATFILGCQTSKGGFARAPNASPNIDLTHLALQGLANLIEHVPFHDS